MNAKVGYFLACVLMVLFLAWLWTEFSVHESLEPHDRWQSEEK